MFHKKIRYGLDLSGNAIINSYVPLPTTDNQIANKIYVDVATKFDTVNALTKPASLKFPWVNNFANQPLKNVLDKLLFPTIYPVYTNPVLQSFKLYNFGEQTNVIGSSINGRLNYVISNSSRSTTTTYKLVVKYTNNTEILFKDTNYSGYIDFNFQWNNIQSIKLTQIFTPVTVQNDSDGNPYVDSNFSTTYDFQYSFDLNEFVTIFQIQKGIYYIQGITETNLSNYLTSTFPVLTPSLTFGNNIPLIIQEPNDIISKPNNTLLLIHETLINKFVTLTFKESNKHISSLEQPVKKYFLQDTSNNFYLVTNGTDKYYFALIDFGKYLSVVNVLISF